MIQLYVRCMMKKLSKTLLMSPAVSLVLPASLFVSFNSAYASLVDTSQNQTFESRPQAAAISKRPVSSPFIKLAAVHFIANDGNLSFGNQEFLPEDICKQGGYTHKGCPAGYVKGEACPEDGSYVKDCIDPDTWCKNNGYEVTGCQVPQYPQGACPYGSGYYKSCETDNIRACKELGYSLTCEAGKVGDTNQSCPYNESYKKCVCNPCGGYDYTASEANAQGYTPGEVCNSCGTMKYKRSANACDGFKECTDGGAAGAEVCYSGSLKKFSECKEVCDPKFQYDSSNCTGDKVLTGNSCGGKYEGCTSRPGACSLSSKFFPTYNPKDYTKPFRLPEYDGYPACYNGSEGCLRIFEDLMEKGEVTLNNDVNCGNLSLRIDESVLSELKNRHYKLHGNGHRISFEGVEEVFYFRKANLSVDNLTVDFHQIEDDFSTGGEYGYAYRQKYIFDSGVSTGDEPHINLTNVNIISNASLISGVALYGTNNMTFNSGAMADDLIIDDISVFGTVNINDKTPDNGANRSLQNIDVYEGQLNYKGNNPIKFAVKGTTGIVNLCMKVRKYSPFTVFATTKAPRENIRSNLNCSNCTYGNAGFTVIPDLCESDVFSGTFWK